MQHLLMLLPLILITANIFIGYRLMNLKGYTGWSYLYLVFAVSPLFWIVAGSYDSKVPTERTKLWSLVSVVYGVVILIWYVYFKYGNNQM